MRLDNRTAIADAVVREAIRFACPAGVTRYDVTVLDVPHSYSGHAYPEGRDGKGQSWELTVKLGPASLFPRGPRPSRGGAYLPDPWMRDRIDALVFVLAHEFRHLWQARIPRGRRVWGARGQFSERDADAYGLRILRAWRRRDLTDAGRRPYASPLSDSAPRGRRAALPPMR